MFNYFDEPILSYSKVFIPKNCSDAVNPYTFLIKLKNNVYVPPYFNTIHNNHICSTVGFSSRDLAYDYIEYLKKYNNLYIPGGLPIVYTLYKNNDLLNIYSKLSSCFRSINKYKLYSTCVLPKYKVNKQWNNRLFAYYDIEPFYITTDILKY